MLHLLPILNIVVVEGSGNKWKWRHTRYYHIKDNMSHLMKNSNKQLLFNVTFMYI